MTFICTIKFKKYETIHFQKGIKKLLNSSKIFVDESDDVSEQCNISSKCFLQITLSKHELDITKLL